MKTIVAADLFAGAGGTSTGLIEACELRGLKLKLTAVNHWPVAIETHAANHPAAEHHCTGLDSVDPRRICPGRLDVLMASPECTHHSNARGGKPCDDQSRSTAWHVVRWAEALRPRAILVENVREFEGWGPLGTNGRPLKSKKGAIFHAWVNALEAIGYKVSWRLVNAANYGGATTRTRLFVEAVRGRCQIHWAEISHERDPQPGLFGTLRPWRAAREVIDWTLPGKSIFGRKTPLKPNTIARIMEGIRLFWGVDPEPFLVRLRGTSAAHIGSSALPVSEPIPTLTAGRNIGLCEPFVIGQHSGAVPRSVHQPMPTVAGAGAISIVQPFLVPTNYGEREGQRPRTHSVGAPLPTVVGSGTHGLVEPFMVSYYSNGQPLSIHDPLDTITGRDRFGLVTPSGAIIADVLFRMLQPHELAAGMGFPAGYRFAGNRGDVVKQIGNAVEVNVARAHLNELLGVVA